MPVYWVVRAILQPFFHIYFRLRRMGLEHIPKDGPVLLAANHRSFSDPFLIGCCLGRPLHFVAKIELFDKRWKAWILLALGAFPIRRGESDEDAMETARVILERGGAVGIFPEGTRVRPGPARRAQARRRAASRSRPARPIVPVAIIGTEDIRRGWRIRPRRVTVRCGRALRFPRPLDREPRQAAAQEISNRVWSCISLQWEWLGGLQPIRHAVVVGAGSWGTAVATLLARSGATVQLGCRTAEQARELGLNRMNAAYLPGVELPENVRVVTVDDLRFDDVDLLCLAVPSRALPDALDSIRDRMPDGPRRACAVQGPARARTARCRASSSQSALGARPIACLGGPAHAGEAVRRGAHVTVASPDRTFAALIASSLRRARPRRATRAPTSWASSSREPRRTPPRWPPAPRMADGPNAAGAAAGRVYEECHALADKRGAAPRASPAQPARATWSRPCSRHTAATAGPGSCSRRASSPPRSTRSWARSPSRWTRFRCSPRP